MLGRSRKSVDDHAQNFRDPDEFFTEHYREYRMEMPSGHCLFEVFVEHGHIEFFTGEEAIQQGLVLRFGDDSLNERAAGVLGDVQMLCFGRSLGGGVAGVVDDRAAEQGDQPRDRFVIGQQWQVHRLQFLTKRSLAASYRFSEIRTLLIHSGDCDGPRHSQGLALLPQQLGGRIDAVNSRNHK